MNVKEVFGIGNAGHYRGSYDPNQEGSGDRGVGEARGEHCRGRTRDRRRAQYVMRMIASHVEFPVSNLRRGLFIRRLVSVLHNERW